ncbi:PREDICTED: 39S ribosomal protein L21, mitochondrial [Polistes canadensis]|uniref:39S ribosomal protein L21, mitochondrial n=1 Tax=Polistes canadensis TaxID=91411 RepID=UPI000718F513|nr:PREDICTED: 39S ribosomal protein L21, mitochondrial [Polistes canadensis]
MAALTIFSNAFKLIANNCFKKLTPSTICRTTNSALSLWEPGRATYITRLGWMPPIPKHQVEVPEIDEEKEKIMKDVTKEINKQIAMDKVGRLFAVVHLCGKQFKITENDIIIIQGHWPPTIGDKIKLEKVLLVGGTDFTLIGKPILNGELVSINATVIEKTLSSTKYHFRMKKRKQYRRLNFYRTPHTMLRINTIDINGDIDKRKGIEEIDRIY